MCFKQEYINENHYRNIFHVIVGVDEMVENVIENKSKKMINSDVNLRNNWSKFKKQYFGSMIFNIFYRSASLIDRRCKTANFDL